MTLAPEVPATAAAMPTPPARYRTISPGAAFGRGPTCGTARWWIEQCPVGPSPLQSRHGFLEDLDQPSLARQRSQDSQTLPRNPL